MIAQDETFYNAYQGQHPVIFLSLDNLVSTSFKKLKENIEDIIISAYRENLPIAISLLF
jgi:hypothetical protein